MTTVLEIAVNNAILVTLLAAGIAVFSFLRSNPAAMHCLWVLLLIKLVTPPLFRIAVPVVDAHAGVQLKSGDSVQDGPLSGADEQRASGNFAPSALNGSARDDGGNNLAHAVLPPGEAEEAPWFLSDRNPAGDSDAGLRPVASPDDTEEPHATGAAPAQTVPGADSEPSGWVLVAYRPVWGMVWLGGCLLCLIGLVMRIIRFERCLKLANVAPASLQQEAADLARRLGLSRSPQILVVPGRISPMLWSFGRTPRILFPRALLEVLTDRQRTTLLLHELLHYRRGDHRVRLLECLVTVLYWWYPLVWWIRRQLHEVEEVCCDDRVVAEFPGDRESYAAALLMTISLTSQRSAGIPPLACGIGGFESVKRRLTGIMLVPTRRRLSNWSKFALALFAFVFLPLFPALARLQATLPQLPAVPREFSPRLNRDTNGQPLPTVTERIAAFRPLRDPDAGSDTSIPSLARLRVPDGPPAVTAFAADGTTLMVGDANGNVLLYDLVRGASPRSFGTGRPGLSHIAVAPEGNAIAFGWPDGGVRVWSPTSSQPPTELPPLSSRLYSLTYTADGKQLLAGSISQAGVPVVHTWDPLTHRSRTIRFSQHNVEHLVLSPDGKLLATAGRGSASSMEVRIWDVFSGHDVQRFTTPSSGEWAGVSSLCFSRDNTVVIAADRQQHLFAWQRTTGRQLLEIETSAVVTALAVHPDNRHLAFLQSDGALELWDAAEGNCRARFEGHPDVFSGESAAPAANRCVAFSPDGSVLTSVGADPQVRLWTVATDAQSQTIQADEYAFAIAMTADDATILIGGNNGATLRRREDGTVIHDLQKDDAGDDVGNAVAVTISPDGRTAITGGDQHVLRVWDLQTGLQQAQLDGHTDTIRSVAYSPDGQNVLSGSYDGQAIAWDLKTARERYRLEGDGSRVNAVAISKDGRLAAVGGTFSTRIHELATGRELQHLIAGTPVASLSFSPDGTRLLSGHNDASLRMWDVRQGTQLRQLTGHTGPLESVSFSPDGRFAASGGQDHRLLLWDLQHPWRCLQLGLLDATIKAVRFTEEGRELISVGTDGALRSWDLTSAGEVRSLADRVRRWSVRPPQYLVSGGQPRHAFASDERQTAFILFSPDGKTYATGGSDRLVRIYDRDTNRLLAELSGHQAGITSGAFFPDGRRLATTSWAPENAVRIWDVASRSQVALLEGHSGPVRMVAVSADGRFLATASEDRTVRLWDALKFRLVRSLPEQRLPVFSVAFSSDGRTLATGTGGLDPFRPGEVTLWDTVSGRQLHTLVGFRGLHRSLSFAPDGTRLVAKKSENTISWIDLSTQQTGWEIRAAAGPLACSPDGRTVASGQLDGSIRVWDASDGRLLADFRRHDSHVRWLAYSPEGSLLGSAGLDGTIMIWDVPQPDDIDPLEPLVERSTTLADSTKF